MEELQITSPETRSRDGVSPAWFLTVVLRHRAVMIISPIVVAAVLFGVVWMFGEFTAQGTFAVQGSSRLSASGNLGNLASQFGLRPAAGLEGETVEFYSQLLTSKDLLTATVETEYRFAVEREGADTLSGTLVSLYEAEGDTELERVSTAVGDLSDRVSVEANAVAGLVTLRVRARWAELAEAVTGRMIELVNEFNVEKRRTQAGVQREFVEGRLEIVGRALRDAEDVAMKFTEENRSYQGSPELALEAARLQRDIARHNQVYTRLIQVYEDVRIEEVRTTPVITVLDTPDRSASAGPGGLMLLVVSLAAGGLVALGLAFGLEYIRQDRLSRPGDYDELSRVATRSLPGLGGRKAG